MTALRNVSNILYELQGSKLKLTVSLKELKKKNKLTNAIHVANSTGPKLIPDTKVSISLYVDVRGDQLQLPENTSSLEITGEDGPMKNVDLSISESILNIIVDLTKDFGKSSVVGSNLVASTSGMKNIISSNIFLKLSVFTKQARLSSTPAEVDKLCGAEVSTSDNECIFTIDISENPGDDKSGKVKLIATTSGHAQIPGTNLVCKLVLSKNGNLAHDALSNKDETELEKGIKYALKDGKLVLRCNISKAKSGNTNIVLTTRGMKPIPNLPFSVNLGIYGAKSRVVRLRPRTSDEADEPKAKRAKV